MVTLPKETGPIGHAVWMPDENNVVREAGSNSVPVMTSTANLLNDGRGFFASQALKRHVNLHEVRGVIHPRGEVRLVDEGSRIGVRKVAIRFNHADDAGRGLASEYEHEVRLHEKGLDDVTDGIARNLERRRERETRLRETRTRSIVNEDLLTGHLAVLEDQPVQAPSLLPRRQGDRTGDLRKAVCSAVARGRVSRLGRSAGSEQAGGDDEQALKHVFSLEGVRGEPRPPKVARL